MSRWQLYWAVWIAIGFMAPETWALMTDDKNTLSETIWDWFGVMRGQPIDNWSVQHYFLLVFMIWLIFHMVFRIWR